MGSFDLSQTFILELEGKPAGRLSEVSLPRIQADIAIDKGGIGGQITKRLAQKPNDFNFKCGVGMSRVFYDWLKDSFQSNYTRKNGAIVVVDMKQVEKHRIEFIHALITSVKMPKLGKSSKDAGLIEVAMTSEDIKLLAGGTKMAQNPYITGVDSSVTAYKVSIDKLEKECEAISEIGSIGVGTKVKADYSGESRIPVLTPSSAAVTDFSVSVPDPSSKAFTQWFNQVATGNASSGLGRNGTIEYLASNSKTAHFILSLTGIGIASAAVSTSEREGSSTSVTLYCDSVDFSAASSAVR